MAKEFNGSEANLVALYHLEDVTDSKASYDLTNNGTATFTAAKFSNGVNLGTPNSTKYLSITNNLGFTGDANFTFICWVKLLSEIGSGRWGFVGAHDNATRTRIGISYEYNAGTQRIVFYRLKTNIGDRNIYYTIALGTSDFYQIAATYDGSNLKGFVNGSEVATVAESGSGDPSGGGDHFTIVRAALSGDGTPASALIDEVGVFDEAKSQSFIQSYYSESRIGVGVGSPMMI